MKKTYSVVAVALGALLLVGCNAQDGFYDKVVEDFGVPTGVSAYTVKDSIAALDTTTLKYHGRYFEDTASSCVWISFTNSGFEITFEGTTLEGDFLATHADDVKNKPFVAVAIDNDYDPERAEPIQFSSNGKYANGKAIGGGISEHKHVVLAHDLPYGVHTVRVYKRSECQCSRLAVRSLATDGKILPVQAKELGLKLEFYGDSVTCGYGVESPDFYENFNTRTENGLKTYANYAANLLNADISCVSAGGYPLYQSIYSENNNPSDIPSFLHMAEFEYQTSFDHSWDNSKYVPDAVIIALGANDGSKLRQYEAGSKEYNDFLTNFRATYYSFIDSIFQTHPDTLVVISDEVLDIFEGFSTIADEVAADLAAQGKNVMRVKFTSSTLAKDKVLPGGGHPNKEMHLIAGHQLAKALAERFNIPFDDSDFWLDYE